MGYNNLNVLAKGADEGTIIPIFRSEPYTGGVVSRYAPQFLDDNQASKLVNVDLDDITRPKLRDGYLILGDTTAEMEDGIDSSLLAKRIAGFGYLQTALGTKLLFIAIDDGTSGRCYFRTAVTAGGSWAEALLSSASFYVNTSDAPVFQANDGLVIIPDSATPPVVLNSSGVLFAGTGGTSNNNPPTGVVDGCYMLNRVWLFKQGTTTLPPTLHYSKVLPAISASWNDQFNQDGATVASSIAGRLQLSPNNGGGAVAVRPWNEASLICFFTNCIEEVLVFPTSPQGGSERRVIESRWGCGSRGSVVTIGLNMYYLDQYGFYRALAQTITGAQAGNADVPLSDPIADELPGRLNKAAMSKVQAIAFKDKLYVAYPRDDATEARHVAVYSLSRQRWEGYWRLGRPVGKWVISSIRGDGDELWYSDATTGTNISPKLYRMFPGTYTDNGSGYYYRESSKALDFGQPECDKRVHAVHVEVNGDPGATAIVSIQADEDGENKEFEDPLVVEGVGGSSFPLTTSSYTMSAASFPLMDPQPTVQESKFRGSELGTEWSRGRTLRLTIRTTSVGKRFERMGYRIMAHIDAYREID